MAKKSTGKSKPSTTNKSKKTEAQSGGSFKIVWLAILVALIAFGYNYYQSNTETTPTTTTPTAEPTPAPTPQEKHEISDDIDLDKMKPKTELVDGVELNTITLAPTTGDEVEVVGESEIEKHSKEEQDVADAWVRDSLAEIEAYSDNRKATPIFTYSDDAHVSKIERTAVFLRDHFALTEFMAFPYAPAILEQSPSMSAMPVDERKKLHDSIFANVRKRLETSYWTHQRVSKSFRDSFWASYYDFEEFVGSKVEDFLQMSAMERQIAAKEVSAENELFESVAYIQNNFLVWNLIDEITPNTD